MYGRKRTILAALNYSPDGTGGEGAAGGQTAGQQQGAPAQGQQQGLPAGVAPGSAAAQALQGQTQQTSGTDATGQAQGQQSGGMVPVGELAAERKRRQDLEAQIATLTANQTKFQDGVKQALGLSDAKTPEQLQAAATAAQAQLRSTNAQLAVTRLAAAAGGDAGALLDSATFLKKLDTVDPSKDEDVTQAIKDAVAANKALGLTKVPPAGSGDAGRVGGDGKPEVGLNDLLRATRS